MKSESNSLYQAMEKPYAESCDQNRDAILAVLAPLLRDRRAVLEIGSGTGQHAVYFGARLPHLTWQTSDVSAHHRGIRMWLAEADLPNVREPLTLDVMRDAWPELRVDAVFSANTVHIMSWSEVEACFEGVGRVLVQGGVFALYGPFNYDGSYTSESNARFDAWLKARDPRSGIRDVDELNRIAAAAGMWPREDFEMPVNNRILCWEKQ